MVMKHGKKYPGVMLLKRNYIVLCIFFLIGLLTNAQNFSKIMEGKVLSESMDVSDVHVINTTAEKATITNSDGYFTIMVKLNDTIWFSGVQYERQYLIINNEILERESATVTLEEALTELEEVVITPYNLSGDIYKDIQYLKIEDVVTSSSLGLPNADVKTMSPSERKLFSAGQKQVLFKLIDEISGNNKKLKKLLKPRLQLFVQ